jgi:hypothetical protein
MKNLLILLLVTVSSVVSAQSYTNPLKPVPKPFSHRFSISLTDSTSAVDSSLNTFRPIANLGSYTVPGNSLLTGAGISYQHLTFSQASQKWSCIWSVSAIAWYKAPLDPSVTNPNAFAYGLSGGILNNLILAGVATDGKNVFATLGIGISFNN